MITQLQLALRSHLDKALRPSGLTASQHAVLTMIDQHGHLTTAELARNSFVTWQAMADIVTALERRQLIERRRDSEDRRRLIISLTHKGRHSLELTREKVAAVEAQMVSGLTKRQAAYLRCGLSMVARKLPRGLAI